MKIVSLDRSSPAAQFRCLALLHESELQAGLLTKLGAGFLESFYRYVAGDADSLLLAAIDGDRLVGFVSGTSNIGKFYRRYLLHRGLQLAVHLLPFLLRRGSLSPIGSFRSYLTSRSTGNLPASELTSLAVDPGAQRGGVGKALFIAFREEFRKRGIREFKVSAATTQGAALRFYPALGAKQAANTRLGELDLVVFICETGATAKISP